MNIDAFDVDTKDIVMDCAKKAGVELVGSNPIYGANYDQVEKILRCKISLLPEDSHASGLIITGLNFSEDPDGDGEEKSPCKEIETAIANGGSAAIGIKTFNGGEHMTQVTEIDCEDGTMVVHDPNGYIVEVRFTPGGDLLLPETDPPSKSVDSIYDLAKITGVVIEHKVKK
jgi:hypothetical protein